MGRDDGRPRPRPNGDEVEVGSTGFGASGAARADFSVDIGFSGDPGGVVLASPSSTVELERDGSGGEATLTSGIFTSWCGNIGARVEVEVWVGVGVRIRVGVGVERGVLSGGVSGNGIPTGSAASLPENEGVGERAACSASS